MFNSKIKLFVVVFSALTLADTLYSSNQHQEHKTVCYIGTWAAYRPGEGKYTMEDVDPFLCTHLIYAFAGLDSATNRIMSLDPWLDLCNGGGLCGFQKFAALKQKNSDLKTLLAIGGWNEGSTKYSKMAMQSSTRNTFIDSCVSMLLEHGFDGLDLDWEYPATRGGHSEDKKNFKMLVQEMKQTFSKYGLLVTAAVSAGKDTIDAGYDVPELARSLDLVSLMTYDYHGGWESFTHHHAPMYEHPQDNGSSQYFNVKWTVEYWLSLGAPAEKLVLGIPVYGRSYTLNNEAEKDVRAPATKGKPGRYTREAGILGYNEICSIQRDTGSEWTVSRDSHLVSPYAVFRHPPGSRLQWVGYEDQISVAQKVELVSSYGLGGAMVWSLEMDDFGGHCDQGNYPLVNTIKNNMNSNATPNLISPSTSTASPRSTRRLDLQPPTTARAPPHQLCKTEGVNADPTDCSAFYVCTNESGAWTVYKFRCPNGLAFNSIHLVCDWPKNVEGCKHNVMLASCRQSC